MPGAQAPLLYAISLTVVFLCLFGALLGMKRPAMNKERSVQIVPLSVLDLLAKNSILLVDFFVKDPYQRGMELYETRLRVVIKKHPFQQVPCAIRAELCSLNRAVALDTMNRILSSAGQTLGRSVIGIKLFHDGFVEIHKKRAPPMCFA